MAKRVQMTLSFILGDIVNMGVKTYEYRRIRSTNNVLCNKVL